MTDPRRLGASPRAIEKAVSIRTAIWRDAAFLDLDRHAQWLYFALRSQRETSPAGVLPLTMKRWANLAAGVTESMVAAAVADLDGAGFALADYDRQELLVRGHIREESSPKYVVGVALAGQRAASPLIRAAINAEIAAIQGRTPTTVRDPRLARIRLAVYRASGYCCQECGWTAPVPAGYDGRFALCEYRLNDRGQPTVILLELDHIFPESRGGEFVEENLQALCSSCNARKGARI